jgi:hypothetical protein
MANRSENRSANTKRSKTSEKSSAKSSELYVVVSTMLDDKGQETLIREFSLFTSKEEKAIKEAQRAGERFSSRSITRVYLVPQGQVLKDGLNNEKIVFSTDAAEMAAVNKVFSSPSNGPDDLYGTYNDQTLKIFSALSGGHVFTIPDIEREDIHLLKDGRLITEVDDIDDDDGEIPIAAVVETNPDTYLVACGSDIWELSGRHVDGWRAMIGNNMVVDLYGFFNGMEYHFIVEEHHAKGPSITLLPGYDDYGELRNDDKEELKKLAAHFKVKIVRS